MGSIDNMSLSRTFTDNFTLSTEFETEEFGEVGWWTSEIVGYIHDVGNDSFDAVAFSFDLGLNGMHFVAVKDVVDVSADIDHSHFGGL